MKGKEGKIYILRNPYYKDAIIKIGRTSRISEKRAKEISGGTGVPAEFEVLFEEDVFDSHLAENLVHSKLKEKRVTPNREFFQLPLKVAVKTVFETCAEINDDSLRKASSRLLIVVDKNNNKNTIKHMAEALSKYKKGKVNVYVLYEGNNATALIKINGEWDISLSPALINELKTIKGISSVQWMSCDLEEFDKSHYSWTEVEF